MSGSFANNPRCRGVDEDLGNTGKYFCIVGLSSGIREEWDPPRHSLFEKMSHSED